MRDTRPGPRGPGRQNETNQRSLQGMPTGIPRGASPGGRSRSQAQAGYQRSQPQKEYTRGPAITFAGIRISLPTLRIGTALLLAAIVVAVIVGIANNASQKKALYSKTITQGVKIDNQDVSGMDVNTLERQIEAQYQKKIDEIAVNITYNGKVIKTLTGHDIGATDNAGEIVSEASLLARTGSAEDRVTEARQVKASGKDFDVALSIDADALKIKLIAVANSVSKPGQDATVSFNPTLASFADPDEPTQDEINQIPTMFTINPEVAGLTVNVDKMQQQIMDALKNADKCTIALITSPFVPKVTSASLKDTFQVLSVFHTHISSVSTAERVSNIKTAISMFNGKVLTPGQELSFNDTTGPRTAGNGYQMAHVINNNQYVDDWGGGVCQASTTLYNAALLAGCTITDSGHHSIPSDYVPKGFDAMVNYPGSDLKFVNPYDTPIYIKTFVTKKNNVYVMFFGAPLPDGEKIALVNNIVSQGDLPTTDIQQDNKGQYADFVTYQDEQYQVMLPHPSIDVITYRVYEDKDGHEIKREQLREDKFKAINGLIVIGSKVRPEGSPEPSSTTKSNAAG